MEDLDMIPYVGEDLEIQGRLEDNSISCAKLGEDVHIEFGVGVE